VFAPFLISFFALVGFIPPSMYIFVFVLCFFMVFFSCWSFFSVFGMYFCPVFPGCTDISIM